METALSLVTSSEWAAWLAKEEGRLREVYVLSPERLIAEYRREHEITRGYHGREVLELLQNAADAARKAISPGRVRIIANQYGLIMGNTGQPFDNGGVQSLQIANLSPKRQREGMMIGDKGLGFRSILNWTNSPLISSGEMGLAFLPEYAKKIVRELENRTQKLADLVDEERQIAGELIVPRLAFPQLILDWASHEWPNEKGICEIAACCKALRDEGFDTAIGMPFNTIQAYGEVVRQIAELRPEFLLLVDSISQLEIQIEGNENKIWRCVPRAQQLTILDGEKVISTWTVKSITGKVPEELLDRDENIKDGFTLTLAVPSSNQPGPGCLFCYFPTDVRMPLPLLAHATLELDETRKHLNDTRANRHILGVLAEQIAQLAEKETGCVSAYAWAGCQLVTPVGAFSGELDHLGFSDALHRAAQGKKIVPVLNGGHLSAKEAKRVPGDETKWWSQRLFPEVAAFTKKKERTFAEYLKVDLLLTEQIVQRLITAVDLTLEERAYAIAGLLQGGSQPTGDNLSTLLCDETATQIPIGVSAILQPIGELPQLPDWAAIRFLHPTLRDQLGFLLGIKDSRELQLKLRPFGVVEYSLAALIRPVLAEANRLVRNQNEREKQIRTETLAFLWHVFQGIGGTSAFPSDLTVRLPTQRASWANSNQLYLGEGYEISGNVTQDLYAGWAIEKLIVRPNELGLDTDSCELTKFLLWLGVARWPRELTAETIEPEFISFIKNGLRYPVQFDEFKFDSPQDLMGAWLANAKTVEGLSQILKYSGPEAVLAWLSLDQRAVAWGRVAPEHGLFKIRPAYQKNDRIYRGPLPSYAHWQISNYQWLPTVGGGKKAPRHCLLGDRQLEALFQQPAQPSMTLRDRYGISERIADCYLRAGVMPGLGQLGRDELYHLLLEVPPLSPDGKANRALCRWFLLNESDLFGLPGEYQKRFFQEGRVWGSKNDRPGYYKISELRHVDFDGLPPALLRKLTIADLPKRVGALKVKMVLGITALDRSSIRQELVTFQSSPAQTERSLWFDLAKPDIKRLRNAQTKQPQAVGAFDRLELVVCDMVCVQLEYEGISYNHEAHDGEWFVFLDKLYVKGDLDDSIDLLADSAGVAIASIFGLADGDAFSKVLRCDPKSRQRLLRRMCGDDFIDELELAKTTPLPRYSGPIEQPTIPNAKEKETPGGQPAEAVNVGTDIPSESKVNDSMKEPGIKPVEHLPQPPKSFRKLVIRNIQRSVGIGRLPRQVVDGDKCEKLAQAFEEQSNPPRFALGVGHIMGTDAPGFDLVSFNSAEDREKFQRQSTRDWTIVQRFIEVKGRSSATAKIELKGNELKAARQYSNHYFLYRFYEETDGQFMVSILENPLGAGEAINPIIEVDLERAKTTKRFEFIVNPHDQESANDEPIKAEIAS